MKIFLLEPVCPLFLLGEDKSFSVKILMEKTLQKYHPTVCEGEKDF